MENAEAELRQVFADRSVADHLLTDRYWRLRQMADGDRRPHPLIYAEVTVQKNFLLSLAAQREAERSTLEVPLGTVPLVVDTNVFLHCRHLDEGMWRELVGGSPVRLFVPLLVVDELDEKSYASSSTGPKAKRVIRTMQRSRCDAPADQPVRLRAGVDWLVMMDPPGHQRLSNSDGELLRRAEHLARFAPGVTIVSSDYGIRLRAQALGLASLAPPDEWQLRASSKDNTTKAPDTVQANECHG